MRMIYKNYSFFEDLRKKYKQLILSTYLGAQQELID